MNVLYFQVFVVAQVFAQARNENIEAAAHEIVVFAP